jgi:hypothetical protein
MEVKWISIKDKLPSHCDGVLVCGYNPDINAALISFAKIDCGTKKWRFFNEQDAEVIMVPYSDCGWEMYLSSIEYWAYLPKTPFDKEIE